MPARSTTHRDSYRIYGPVPISVSFGMLVSSIIDEKKSRRLAIGKSTRLSTASYLLPLIISLDSRGQYEAISSLHAIFLVGTPFCAVSKVSVIRNIEMLIS